MYRADLLGCGAGVSDKVAVPFCENRSGGGFAVWI
jgi:hypothetical protein